MSDILNIAFCEIARASHSLDLRPRDQRSSFSSLTQDKYVAKCRETAAEAERIASYVSVEARTGYFELAKQLTALADELETELSRTT